MRFRAHQLENQLPTLDPKYFSCIENLLSKFKALRLVFLGCEILKKDDGIIYVILTKLGLTYYVFTSTFHSTRETFISQGSAYKAPSFDAFSDSLIIEHGNILD